MLMNILLGIGFVVLLVAVAAIRKKKPADQSHPVPVASTPWQSSPQPVQQVVYRDIPQISLREQQLTENAAMYAQEYRAMIDQQERELIRESLKVAEAYKAIKAEKDSAATRALFAP
jgi:hypothetical protein